METACFSNTGGVVDQSHVFKSHENTTNIEYPRGANPLPQYELRAILTLLPFENLIFFLIFLSVNAFFV